MCKIEFIIISIIGAIIIFLIVAISSIYTNIKVCEAKGGVYMSENCLKKDLFIE